LKRAEDFSRLKRRRASGWDFWTQQPRSKISVSPASDWKRLKEIGGASTVSGSTTSFGFVLLGGMGIRTTSKSWIIIRRTLEAVDMAHTREKTLPPIHPGEVLQDLLHEAGLTRNAVALALRVPPNRVGSILKGQRGISADTALRLGRYFGTSAQMWMNLQSKYDLAVAEDALRKQIEREVLPLSA
jgi:addiction module HigA family antidote